MAKISDLIGAKFENESGDALEVVDVGEADQWVCLNKVDRQRDAPLPYDEDFHLRELQNRIKGGEYEVIDGAGAF